MSDEAAEPIKEPGEAERWPPSAHVCSTPAAIARTTNAQVVDRLRERDRTDGPSSPDIVAEVHSTRR